MPDFSTYAWNQLSPGTSPSERWGHAMVWDGSRIIMFGGHDQYPFGSGHNDETWEFDGTDWNQLSPSTSPSARSYHSMVWDGSNVILHGGASATSGATGLQDTWVFDGADWTDVTPGGTKPTVRSRHGAVWNGSAMIMYGGQTTSVIKHDTWSWNGSAWTQLTPTHYPGNHTGSGGGSDGRGGMGMLWDTAKVFFFGGFWDTGGGGEFQTNPYFETDGGTWIYDSGDWTQPDPTTNPASRWGQGFCVTDDDQKILMFGGNVSAVGGFGNFYTAETWEFDGTDWNQLVVTGPDRRQGAMVWDDDNARGLLFGGIGDIAGVDDEITDETWEFATTVEPADPVKAINNTFGLG